MQQIRQSPKPSWLALFALALQFVLSFGHFHNHFGDHKAHAAAQSVSCEQAGNSNCVVSGEDDDDEDHCATCMTMAQRSIVLTDTLPIYVPEIPPNTFEPQQQTASLPYTVVCQYQARAPPRG